MPAKDPHASVASTMIGPSAELINIVPHATNELDSVVRQIRVGGAGDVVVVTVTGGTHTFKDCSAGEVLGPFRVLRVLATSTATDLIGYV